MSIAVKNIFKLDLARKLVSETLIQQEIYPSVWDEGEEAFEYLYAYFIELQEFDWAACDRELAVITYIN